MKIRLDEVFTCPHILPDIENPKYVKAKRDIWFGHNVLEAGKIAVVSKITFTERQDYITVRYLGSERMFSANDFWSRFTRDKGD